MTDWQLPTYAWRPGANGPEQRLFTDEVPGEGWYPTPGAAERVVETQPETPATDDLSTMSKEQLEAFALDRFGVDVDRRKSPDRLAREIQAMIDDAS